VTTPLDISEYRARLWYGSRVERWFCGVFEGGAAKGVAYPGALEALAEHGAWFHAVAGTSAGAITAAYVASGADPGDAKAFTIEMFGRLEAGPTVRRLIERGTLYSGRALRDWLDEQLAAQVAAITGREPARPVSFASLYAASGIELFTVATNLSLNEQIVFSHLATPACGVAEAAVASSATPLIFESRMLEIPSSNRTWHHTIVDGGLWSNFPMFVFAEAAFRRAHGAEPVVIDARDVLGFLLDDTAVPAIEIDSRIVFVADDEPVEAFEWSLGLKRRIR
jgi:NTE family protein